MICTSTYKMTMKITLIFESLVQIMFKLEAAIGVQPSLVMKIKASLTYNVIVYSFCHDEIKLRSHLKVNLLAAGLKRDSIFQSP